jgi:hypothetical protein
MRWCIVGRDYRSAAAALLNEGELWLPWSRQGNVELLICNSRLQVRLFSNDIIANDLL